MSERLAIRFRSPKISICALLVIRAIRLARIVKFTMIYLRTNETHKYPGYGQFWLREHELQPVCSKGPRILPQWQ